MKFGKIARGFLAATLAAVMVAGSVVTTSAISAGDVNGDGKLNLKDASLMLKVIAKYDGVDVDKAAADVTGDSKMNLADVALLMKHIAGWQDLAPLPQLGPVLDLEGVDPIDYDDLDYDDTYSMTSDEWLLSYYEQSFDTFLGVCKYFEDSGYGLYGYNVLADNHFATFVKGKKLAHIYWIECESELNVVLSDNSGEALPPKEPAVITGEYRTSVTQLQSERHNGMGYVIQLADGSFIIYDGGYEEQIDQLWETLVSLNGGEENIIIRGWVITHSHNDHYTCFSGFSDKYADKVTLERLIISPVNKKDTDGDTYFHTGAKTDAAKFAGAKILYAHTGMVLSFCNVKMEMLFAAEELYISDARWGSGLANLIDFNSSSLVSRVYTDDYSALFLGDATINTASRMLVYYGDYLRSNMCQAAHHGFESFPLIGYTHIKAEIMWYPTNQDCYDYEGAEDVGDIREAVRNSKYTKEVIVHEHSPETRYFQTSAE